MLSLVVLTPDGETKSVSASNLPSRTFSAAGSGAAAGASNNSSGTLGTAPSLSAGRYSWTVPSTGRYRILAEGAQGGARSPYSGGRGASVTGEWTLSAGTVLRIVVGHQGTNGTNGAGGGGASGVFITSNNSILAMAGGGGGAAINDSGIDAPASSDGGSSSGDGGSSGNGGGKGYSGGDCGWAGGGGGFFSDGYGGSGHDGGNPGTRGSGGAGFSYANGGAGSSTLLCNDSVAGQGGFGAAGGGVGHYGGGGGGGYSGGGGGQYVSATGRRGGAGGGSIASGALTSNIVGGSRSGSGNVVITQLAPSLTTFSTQTTSPANTSSLVYSVIFSESVTGLAVNDFTLSGTSSGWAVSALSGSGDTYTVTLTSSSPSTGTVILTMAQNAVLGAITQQSGPTEAQSTTTMNIDVDPPTASISSQPASPAAAMSLTFGLAFNEAVSGLAAADFSNAGTAVGCVFTPSASSGTSINVVVTQCQEGTLQLVLQSGAVSDAASNAGPVSSLSSSIITLAAQPLTITAADRSINFGGSFTESYTQSGLIGGDTITSVSYSYSGTTTLGTSYGPSTTKPTQGGTYSITPTPTYAAGNLNRYSLTRINGTLTIARVAQSTLAVSSTTATYGQTLTLTSSGGSGTGAVSFSVVSGTCSLVGSTLTVGTVGSSCVVQATKAGDDNYTSVSSVATSITIGKAQQAVLTVSSTSATYGQTLSLSSSGGSGTGAVSFSVVSGTCSISGSSSLTVGSVGSSCVVKSTKAADNNYFEQNSSNTTITIGRASQTGLSIDSGTSFTTGDSLTLTATGGQSTGVLSWLLNNGDCSLSNATLTATRGGITCIVQVTRAGDANYNSITISETITVNKIVQVLTFASSVPASAQVGDTYTTSVTSSAFLAPSVTISNSSSSVCSIAAGVVTFNAVGTCLISASQAGNDVYSSAAASQSISVGAVPVVLPAQPPAAEPTVTTPPAAPSQVAPTAVNPSQLVTTTTTTTTTTLPPAAGDPVLNEDGTPIELEEGETTAYVQGELVQVRKQSVNGKLLLTLPNNVSMAIGVLPGSNTPAVLSADGELRVFRKDQFLVSADGLLPGTTYTVFMFSEPRELARGTASLDGTVASGVVTPNDVEYGEHTLQLNGVGPDGEVVSISLGFTVLSREDNTLVAILAISAAVLLALLGGRPVWRRRTQRS